MHDLDAPYEPWQPRPGQRVRVRRSGECRSAHHIADGSDDGRTGVVGGGILVKAFTIDEHAYGPATVTFLRPPVARHAHFVTYDDPVPTGNDGLPFIAGQYYAAAELEPVDGATRRGDGTGR